MAEHDDQENLNAHDSIQVNAEKLERAEHDDNLDPDGATYADAWDNFVVRLSDEPKTSEAFAEGWSAARRASEAALDAERAKNTEARLHVMEFHQHSGPLCSDCHTIRILGGKD